MAAEYSEASTCGQWTSYLPVTRYLSWTSKPPMTHFLSCHETQISQLSSAQETQTGVLLSWLLQTPALLYAQAENQNYSNPFWRAALELDI